KGGWGRAPPRWHGGDPGAAAHRVGLWPFRATNESNPPPRSLDRRPDGDRGHGRPARALGEPRRRAWLYTGIPRREHSADYLGHDRGRCSGWLDASASACPDHEV